MAPLALVLIAALPLVEDQNFAYNEGMRHTAWMSGLLVIALTATGCGDGEGVKSGDGVDGNSGEVGGGNIAVSSGDFSAPTWQIGENRSVLHPMESQLASLCFLFQGLPTGVMGTEFVYDTREAQECEQYLAKLLDAPQPYQKELREAAAFLASRIYTDGKGEKHYLLLTEHDAGKISIQLIFGESKSFSLKDRLLRDAIVSYLDLTRDRPTALSGWPKSEKGIDTVRGNVTKLLEEVIVTRKVENDWRSPAVYR